MTFRAPLLLALLAGALTLSACADDGGGTAGTADLDDIREQPLTDRAAYLEGYRLGENFQNQDSTFQLDAFLDGLRTGFSTDSAQALPYLLGYQRGYELQIEGRRDTTLDLNLDLYVAALREGFAGDSIRLTSQEEMEVSEEMQMAQIRRDAATNPRAQAFLDRIEASQAAADSVLIATREREGVQSTESGVLYFVEQAGEGETPALGDRVLITYEGRLVDGTVFDRSEQPIDFVLGEGLIEGMTEAIADMQIGERREIIIPPDLAYGMQGIPNSPIGPNTVLVFDVALVDILDPIPADTTAPAPAPQSGQ